MASRIFRTSRGSWLVWVCVMAPPLAISLWNLALMPARVPMRARLELVVVLLLAIGFVTAWLGAFRLEFTKQTISYRSLFSRTRIFKRADISSAGWATITRPTEGPVTFVIRLTAGDELRINAKPFPREAVRMLIELMS
jgi:hypothetical protein